MYLKGMVSGWCSLYCWSGRSPEYMFTKRKITLRSTLAHTLCTRTHFHWVHTLSTTPTHSYLVFRIYWAHHLEGNKCVCRGEEKRNKEVCTYLSRPCLVEPVCLPACPKVFCFCLTLYPLQCVRLPNDLHLTTLYPQTGANWGLVDRNCYGCMNFGTPVMLRVHQTQGEWLCDACINNTRVKDVAQKVFGERAIMDA